MTHQSTAFEALAEPFRPRQTNLGLYSQLHELGFTVEQIAGVQQAYRVATQLSNGRYRKNERAFICHNVGAASAAARFDRNPGYVTAALLHATYDSGQFPDGGIGGASRAHRAWLRARVPAPIEEIIYRYDRFDFDVGAPERLVQQGYDEADRDLLYIALAHEIDDLADFGLAFAPKYGLLIDSRIEACAQLAERLGKPELAAHLSAHGRAYRESGDWMQALAQRELQGHFKIPNTITYLRHRLRHLRRRPVKVV